MTNDKEIDETGTKLDEFIILQLDRFERLKKELINHAKGGPTRRTKHHFKTRLARMEQSREDFIETHNEIIQLEGVNDEEYMKNDLFNQYEEQYIDSVAELKIKYDELYASNAHNASHASAHNSTQQPIAYQTEFKLPQFHVPEFNGVYTEWPSFHDSFLQVHNHERLTNIHKFQLLKNALTVKVKSLIGHLEITSENYETAWEALIARYNNKRVLFINYIDQFISQPNIINETAEELQSLEDTSNACVSALNKLGIKTDECGEILAHILLKKLPHATRLEWERQLGKSTDIPTFTKLIDFIDIRFRTIEVMYPQSSKTDSKSVSQISSSSKAISSKSHNRNEAKSFHVAVKSIPCPLSCEQSHFLRKCPRFLQMIPQERKAFADKIKICINCLGHSNSQKGSSKNTCFICHGRHHTLLHFEKPISTPIASNQFNANATAFSSNLVQSTDLNSSLNNNLQLSSNNVISAKSNCILLTTALIDIPDINGQLIRFRVLLDQASQQSVGTERALQRLKLPITPICVGVRPMGESQYKIVNKGLIINIHSCVDPNFSVETTVAIIPNITSNLPLFPIKSNSNSYFSEPGQIDFLLGGDVYCKIIQSGLCRGQNGEPIAQNTSLGWILSGEIAHQNHVTAMSVNCLHVSTIEIANYIKKFHELEEVSTTRELSKEDEWTVAHYNRTYQRQSNGKFMVRLPFKWLYDSSIQLGSSFSMALKRFQSLQRRFNRDPKFHAEYHRGR